MCLFVQGTLDTLLSRFACTLLSMCICKLFCGSHLSEPCQPGHVTTHVACNNDTVEFDWADSKGAMSYIISVSGCLGYMVDFNSTESQMEAILPCGQTYNVTVTPQDDRCDGPQSAPKQFKTGRVQTPTYNMCSYV